MIKLFLIIITVLAAHGKSGLSPFTCLILTPASLFSDFIFLAGGWVEGLSLTSNPEFNLHLTPID